jgi:ribosomal protein S18 acetylase RimI-like enzyme
MESFYEESGMWKRLYRLAELNRLQQNFAYADQSKVHQMLVAEVNDNNNSPNIAGFVDIDTRPLPPEFSFPQPRPYLSDLCTLKAYRRQGLAKALVEQCEAFCMNHNKRELFIRVQEHNVAALTMYQRLGYDVVSKALDETSQKARENNQMICTLRKAL